MAVAPVIHVRIVKPRYSRPYPVVIGKRLLQVTANVPHLQEVLVDAKKCLVGFQPPVRSYAEMLASGLAGSCKLYLYELPEGEKAKSLDQVLQVITLLHRERFSRRDVVFIVGGGAASDALGMAAALYKRGLPYINIPTTLLGMVDAAIGGKVAVNHFGVKNLLGFFYQPRAVIEDLQVLETLPESEFLSGLGEVVKYAFTLEPRLYQLLEGGLDSIRSHLAEVIAYSVEAKSRVVEVDEREEYGIREILNYGHTVGHAIEEAYRIPHGIAVAWGCLLEAYIGEELGYTPSIVVDKLYSIITRLGFPRLPRLDADRLTALMRLDKKVYGDVIMGVYSVGIGRAVVIPTRLEDYEEAARRAITRFNEQR